MFSKRSRYGIRAILHIALHTDEENLMGTTALAQNTGINEPMLSKVLQELTKKKMITSKKGRNGGFYMSTVQKSQKLIEVIKELDQSDKLINDCMLGQKSDRTCDTCPYSNDVATIRAELKAIYGTDTIVETAKKLNYKLVNRK